MLSILLISLEKEFPDGCGDADRSHCAKVSTIFPSICNFGFTESNTCDVAPSMPLFFCFFVFLINQYAFVI